MTEGASKRALRTMRCGHQHWLFVVGDQCVRAARSQQQLQQPLTERRNEQRQASAQLPPSASSRKASANSERNARPRLNR